MQRRRATGAGAGARGGWFLCGLPSPVLRSCDCRGRERSVGGADGSGAGGCGALRGARRAQRRQNTNITKVPCLKGMRGKLRPFFRLGNKEKGRLRPGRRGNRARPETGAGRTASRRGLRWSRWLSGQRAAWPTRLGPGRARKPAGRGRAGPGEAGRPPTKHNPTSVYVRTSLPEEERSLLAKRWPLRQRGNARVTTLY